jgi:hypothetical protein
MDYFPFPYYNINIPELEKQIENLSEEEGIKKIRKWVKNNIKYRKDIYNYGIFEYWATPIETFRKGKGDCEDRAILFSWLCYQYYDIKSEFIAIVHRDSGRWHMVSYVKKYKYYFGIKRERNSDFFKNGELHILQKYEFNYFIIQAEYFK